MKRFSKRGFTLVELIVVIAILAILVTIAVPSLVKYIEDAKYAAALAEAKMVYNEVSMQMIVGDWTKGTGSGDNYKPGGIRYELTKHFNTSGTGDVRMLSYYGPTDQSVNGIEPGAYQNHAKIAISAYLRLTEPLKFGYRLYGTRTGSALPSNLPSDWGSFSVTGMKVYCRTPTNASIDTAVPDYIFGTVP